MRTPASSISGIGTLCLVLAALVIGACRRDTSSSIAVAVPRPLPELQLVPVSRVDGEKALLSTVTNVRAGPGNTTILIESRATEIRVFDSTGRQLRTVGRSGRGPGEFRHLSAVGMNGDSIWGADFTGHPIALFTSDGRLVRTIEANTALVSQVVRGPGGAPASSTGPRWEWASPAAFLADGSMIMPAARRIRPSDPTGGDEAAPIWRIGADGARVDTVVLRRARLGFHIIPTGSNTSMWVLDPFVGADWAVVATTGRRIAISSVDTITADRGWYSISLLDDRGTVLYRKRFDYVPAAIGAREIDSVATAIVRSQRSANATVTPDRATALVREVLRPTAFLKPIQGLLVERDGTVWVRGRDVGAEQIWTVINPSGEAVGTVRLPGSRTVHVLDDGAWVIEKNADDVPSVVRYRVRLPERGEQHND